MLRFAAPPLRPWPEVGDIVAVAGTVAPLGFADAYQRRRNAHAAIAATRREPTGSAGAGSRARSTACGGAPSAARAGLAPPEAALLRGMVLGEDERLTEDVRDDFQRSGLAHILAVSGQNVVLLIVLVLAACALTGVPLRARLVIAAVGDPLRAAGRRRTVDPARGRDGRRGPGRRARRASGAALVRAAPGGRRDADAQPPGGRRAGLAAVVRRGHRAVHRRGAAQTALARRMPAHSPRPPRSRSRRRSERRR